MNFTAKRQESAQVSLLGEHDRIEHAPQTAPSGFQRWTTRAQVEQLLAHPRIQGLWPSGEYVAADPCAGTGQLMRHVDELLSRRPESWLAWELDGGLVYNAQRYIGGVTVPWPRVHWTMMDAARLLSHPVVRVVVTNLPWFNVFFRLVGHWRTVAFPNALIVVLCDDQERTRESARQWLADGNMPALIAQIPGRTQFDPPGDGQYPFSCSWYVWRAGERRTTSEVIALEPVTR